MYCFPGDTVLAEECSWRRKAKTIKTIITDDDVSSYRPYLVVGDGDFHRAGRWYNVVKIVEYGPIPPMLRYALEEIISMKRSLRNV